MTERRGWRYQSAEEFEEQLFAAWPRPRRVAMLRERDAAIRAETEALQDSAYLAGATAGFRLGLENDNEGGWQRFTAPRAGYLKTPRASQPEPTKEATCQPAQNTDATKSTGRYVSPAKPSKP